jgi:hypothetical protein
MATFVEKSFGGAGFFEGVRAIMATTGARLFAGTDSSYKLKYVVMDALFYGMETILRPDGSTNPDFNPSSLPAQTFTGYAVGLTNPSLPFPRFRVVVNGTFYDTAYNDVPGVNHWWQGQVIQAGRLIQPPAKSTDTIPLCDCSFIGRNGQRAGRYYCENSKPSVFNSQHPSSKLTYAMGGLLQVIKNKKQAPSLDTTEWYVKGKTIVGLHKTTETIFVVLQEDADFLGTGLDKIIQRLTGANVDDAVKCDSGSSSTLIVDGAIIIECAERKDNSTPHGLAFKLADLKLGGPGSILNAPGVPTDTSNFNGSMRSTPATTSANGKLTLTIKSFGSSAGDNSASIATKLSIQNSAIPTNPLKLEAIAPNNIDLRSDVTFNAILSSAKSVQCVAKLDTNADVDAIVGTVKVIQNGNPIKNGSFFWPILT